MNKIHRKPKFFQHFSIFCYRSVPAPFFYSLHHPTFPLNRSSSPANNVSFLITIY